MGADTQRAYRKEIEDVLLAAAQWIRHYYNVALVSADFVPGREQPESDSNAANSSGSASASAPIQNKRLENVSETFGPKGPISIVKHLFSSHQTI